MNLTLSEHETLAYMAGDTHVAALLADADDTITDQALAIDQCHGDAMNLDIALALIRDLRQHAWQNGDTDYLAMIDSSGVRL